MPSNPPAPSPSDFPTYPDLKGKVALLMGIGQIKVPNSVVWGNGAATARLLSHNGVNVFGCDINIDAAEFTAERLRAEGGICDVVTADVTKSADVEAVINACMAKYGRIDILVNNVGMTAPGAPPTMPESVWHAQIDLNLTSVYLSTRFVLPIMEKQGHGVVVSNASMTAIRYIGKPQIAYAAAKAGLLQMTKHIAAMYASKNIRLNCVVPGLIFTPLVENLGVSDKEADRQVFRQITEHNVPMGWMGDAHDVANAALFLCSAAARYITGAEIVVDGGLCVSTGTGG